MGRGRKISFRPPRTRESILAAAHRFKEYTKPEIFKLPHWLQAGLILRTGEGVWTNVLGAQGQPITDESALKPLLTKERKVNGIYLLDHGRAFIPYGSFNNDIVQEAREFAEGGLARGLEHTPEKAALTLEAMVKTYPRGAYAAGFEPVKEPTVRVVGLDSYRDWNRDVLFVGGDDWDEVGFAFGVLQ